MSVTKPANSVWGLAERNAAELPERLAVAGPSGRLTWAQLVAAAESLVSALAPATRPGERVCICLPSSPQWVVAWLAVRRLGLTGVSTGDRARPAELRSLLRRFQARLLLHEGNPEAERLARECGVATFDLTMLQDTGAPSAPPRTCEAALIQLTSGSSGGTKGVLRTEADMGEEAKNVAQALSLTLEDAVLCATPVYHSFASGLLTACLDAAAPCLLMDRLAPASLLALAAREGATVLAGVPFVFQTLTALSRAERAPMSRLRLAVSGGAPLRPETARLFGQQFGAPLAQEYGLTEAGIVTLNLDGPPESMGCPIPNVAVYVADPDDASRRLATGATGEVVVRRAFPPAGYVEGEDEDHETFTAAGIRTGDLGYLDGEGRLMLTGRIKTMINVAGAKVAPCEVEDALLAHPAVADAAVFGVASGSTGEAVIAVVAPREGTTPSESELLAHCRALLSAYKVPARIHAVSALPRNESGKPDMSSLRREFSGGRLP